MVRLQNEERWLVWLAASAAIVISSEAYAGTTGNIRGTVLDPEGLPVPGAIVSLSAPSGTLGGDKSVTASDDGEYRFNDLLPGPYTVTVSSENFRTVSTSGVMVLIDRTEVVDISLQYGEEAQVITIEGKQKTVDTESVTRGEVLTKEFLDKLPTGRTYQSAVNLAAGVVGSNGGNPIAGGAAYNENTYTLDGINITDPVTGTFSLNFNYDAIQQIEVLLGGYGPEYNSIGGIIAQSSVSGSNNFKFQAGVYYENGNWAPKRDARYAADGFQIAPTGYDSNFQTFEVTSLVSGPVIRDRAWFVFSYSQQRSLINNIGVELPRDYEGHYIFSKLSVQPASDHRFTVLLQTDPTSVDNIVQEADSRVEPEAQGRQAQGGAVGSLRWQWYISSNANLDTAFSIQKSFLEIASVPCTHDRDLGYHPCKPNELEGSIDWETPGRIGMYGAYDSVNWGYFNFDDRWTYSASTKLTMLSVKDPFGGSHDLKFGAEATQNIWDQLQGYSGNTLYYDANIVSYDPQTYGGYYYLELTGPIKFRTSASKWNLFAQDTYKPLPNLTFVYGLRYDHSIMRNDLGEAVVQASMLSPRLYTSWDPWNDQKTKFGGGYGRFSDVGRLSIANFTSASGYGQKLYVGELFGGFTNETGNMADNYPLENRNLAGEKLKTPRTDEFMFQAQREIISDVSIKGQVAYRRTRYVYEPDEANVIYDEDGSAIIGSRYSDPLRNVYRLRTPTLAKRDYIQADFTLDKVYANRWAARLTYSLARSWGTSGSALSGAFLNDPQTEYNYGPLFETDVTHQVKGFVIWELPTDPWQQNVGLTVSYLHGNPYSRFYWAEGNGLGGYGTRIEPRGSYGRLPGVWDVSAKFSQDFDVRRGKMVLSLDVANIFNFQAPRDADGYYIASQNRLLITSRQNSLRLQLGLQYEY